MASVGSSSAALCSRESLSAKPHRGTCAIAPISKGGSLLHAQRPFSSSTSGSSCRRLVFRAAKKPSRRDEGALLNAAAMADADEEDEDLEQEEYVRPKLPGDEPDFWEGPQWNLLGFFLDYLWAIGIFIALIASGVAVRTYNLGAADFKGTKVFKEALEAQQSSKPSPKITEEALQDAPPPLEESTN